MIFVFHGMKPCQHIHLKVFHALAFGFLFYIEHWRQVAAFQSHILQKKLRLVAS